MSTQAHHEQASLFSDDTSTRRHPRHVLSYGLGLDNTAVLLRWLTDPSSRDFDLSDLVVITAMTGDEFSATGADVERYVLPELRRHRVRYLHGADSYDRRRALVRRPELDDSVQHRRHGLHHPVRQRHPVRRRRGRQRR